jgi:hypothetical protein
MVASQLPVPLIPIEVLAVDTDDLNDDIQANDKEEGEGEEVAWVPHKKFLEQLFKWLVEKNNTKTGKTVTLISLGGPHSYIPGI